MAIASLKDRFEQLKIFENIFEFLFDSKNLKSLDDNKLRSSCTKFNTTFIGVMTLGYSNIVKLLVEISVLKHAKYTKTVTSKCETVI